MGTTTRTDPSACSTSPEPELPPLDRSTEALLSRLAVIDLEGWSGPVGTELLEFIRTDMVRPLVVGVGLRGVLASQAEATAWEEAWAALDQPSLRSATQPWGVVWATARRAALGEVVAGLFGTCPRTGWRHYAGGDHRTPIPLSLDELMEQGWDPPAPSPDLGDVAQAADAMNAAINALTEAGWPGDLAAQIVTLVTLDAPPSDTRSTALGWRLLATELGLAPWQARRLTLLLRGTPDRLGLIATLHADGPAALEDPLVLADLRSTRVLRSSSQVTARHRTTARNSGPQTPRQ